MNLPKELTTVSRLSKVVAFILFITLPILSFYIGIYYQQPIVISNPQPDYQQYSVYPTPTVTTEVPYPSNTQRITSEANETDDWIMKKASVCNVTMPLPPKKKEYVLLGTDGEAVSSWNFSENTEKGSNIFDMQFENIASVEINWDKNAQYSRALFEEGYVGVNCSKNTKNHTTQSFAQEVAARFSSMDIEAKSRWEVTQQQQQIWQKDVITLSVSSAYETNTYYVFADNDNVYYIMKESRSNNPNIKNTTQHIFNTLQFASAQ